MGEGGTPPSSGTWVLPIPCLCLPTLPYLPDIKPCLLLSLCLPLPHLLHPTFPTPFYHALFTPFPLPTTPLHTFQAGRHASYLPTDGHYLPCPGGLLYVKQALSLSVYISGVRSSSVSSSLSQFSHFPKHALCAHASKNNDLFALLPLRIALLPTYTLDLCYTRED